MQEAGTGEFIAMRAAERRYHISAATIRKRVAAGLLQTYADPWDSRRRLLKVAELEALLTAAPEIAAPLRRATRT